MRPIDPAGFTPQLGKPNDTLDSEPPAVPSGVQMAAIVLGVALVFCLSTFGMFEWGAHWQAAQDRHPIKMAKTINSACFYSATNTPAVVCSSNWLLSKGRNRASGGGE